MSHDPSPVGARGEFKQSWPALLAASVGIGFGLGALPYYTNGLFIPELETTFGWSRTQLSSLLLVGSIVLILTSPFVGKLVDRFGVRIPAAISLLFMSAAYFALSMSGASFLGYLVVWVMMYVLGSASTAVAFTRTVNERFSRGRGLALGIAMGGSGVVAVVIPLVLGSWIAENWRSSYQVLSAAVFVSAIIVFALIPGRTKKANEAVAVAPRAIGPIVRSGLFLRLALSFIALALAISWLVVHLVPMLRDAGVSPTTAASTAGLIGFAVIIGRVTAGLLFDRFFAPYVTVGIFVLAAAGFVALLLGGPALGPAAAFGVGLALGAEVDLLGYLAARYYGMVMYGRIFGLFYSVWMIGIGFGPLIMAEARAKTGSYTLPIGLALGLLVIAAILVATLPRFPTLETDEMAGTRSAETAP